MQESQQNVDLLSEKGPESRQFALEPRQSSLEPRQSAIEPRKFSAETRLSETRNSLAGTIKRLFRPIPVRRSLLSTDDSREKKGGHQKQSIVAVEEAQKKEKNANLKTTTFAITFSCECATRKAVEVDGLSMGKEITSMISRELVHDQKKPRNRIWPSVKFLGKVRRQNSELKLQGNANGQSIAVPVQAPSSSSTAMKWVVDTISKISGSLHCQKSSPP